MAKQIKIPVDFNPSTTIIDSVTGQVLQPVKAVDVTEDCPGLSGRNRCILFYRADSGLGSIIQIGFSEPGRIEPIAGIHWSIEQITEKMMDADPNFESFTRKATQLGLNGRTLNDMIRQHMPAA